MAGAGQVGLAQSGQGDRQGVDRVGLAQGTHGLVGAGHQPRRRSSTQPALATW
jgi:hypothetical protein